jgi:hypothetical protein
MSPSIEHQSRLQDEVQGGGRDARRGSDVPLFPYQVSSAAATTVERVKGTARPQAAKDPMPMAVTWGELGFASQRTPLGGGQGEAVGLGLANRHSLVWRGWPETAATRSG